MLHLSIPLLDLQLVNFRLNLNELSTNAIPDCLFRAWLEDWEVSLLKNKDPVADVKLKVKH